MQNNFLELLRSYFGGMYFIESIALEYLSMKGPWTEKYFQGFLHYITIWKFPAAKHIVLPPEQSFTM